jgi:hypothetical protein
MYLSDFIKQAFQPCPVQPALVLRWTHPAVTQVLITKPASMPALAKLGKILGKRWGASLGAISQPCLAAGLRFQFHLWVDTCWHPKNALNHPWSSSSRSRANSGAIVLYMNHKHSPVKQSKQPKIPAPWIDGGIVRTQALDAVSQVWHRSRESWARERWWEVGSLCQS